MQYPISNVGVGGGNPEAALVRDQFQAENRRHFLTYESGRVRIFQGSTENFTIASGRIDIRKGLVGLNGPDALGVVAECLHALLLAQGP